MSLTDSVTQQVDKRTYLLLLGQAIKFCKALSGSPLGLAVSVSLGCWHVTQLHNKRTRELTFCCLVGLSLQSSVHVYTYLFFFFFFFLALRHCQVHKHDPMPSAWDVDMLPNHTISRFQSSLTFCCFIGLQSSVQGQEHKLSPCCHSISLGCWHVTQLHNTWTRELTYCCLVGLSLQSSVQSLEHKLSPL